MWPLIFVLILLIPILAIVLDSQLGRALAARLEKRSIGEPSDLMAERIGFLEGEVERLSGELARLEEESQFLHKLLTEKTGGDAGRAALPEGEPER
jgi:uncharacterized small protein (DUF1192 family)